MNQKDGKIVAIMQQADHANHPLRSGQCSIRLCKRHRDKIDHFHRFEITRYRQIQCLEALMFQVMLGEALVRRLVRLGERRKAFDSKSSKAHHFKHRWRDCIRSCVQEHALNSRLDTSGGEISRHSFGIPCCNILCADNAGIWQIVW